MMNKKIVGVVGLASVALVGGTFAYFTQTSTIDNPFNTARYRTVVTEDFNPEDGDKWEPGAKVNKDLYVQNTGDRDVVVRVKFEDIWYRDDIANPFISQQEDDVFSDVTLSQTPLDKEINDGQFDGLVSILDETGNIVEKDLSVVEKAFEPGAFGEGGTWKLAGPGAKWSTIQPDGYFYYMTTLAPGASTGKFLDEVQLYEGLDMGLFRTQFYCKDTEDPERDLTIDFENMSEEDKAKYDDDIDQYMIDNGWVLMESMFTNDPEKEPKVTAYRYSELLMKKGVSEEEAAEQKLPEGHSILTRALVRADKDKQGYSNANYVLRITIETVQATDKAVQDTFGTDGKVFGANWNLTDEDLDNE